MNLHLNHRIGHLMVVVALGFVAVGCVSPGRSAVRAEAGGASTSNIRGTVAAYRRGTLVIERDNGSRMDVRVGDTTGFVGMAPFDLADLAPDSFIGTTTVADGADRRRALQVHVFPAAMAGTGEGFSEWDLAPNSMMTNAYVQGLSGEVDGRTMSLIYAGGEQTVFVPEDVPVVTFEPGDDQLLRRGARVFVLAARNDRGALSAVQILAENNGVVPPM